MGTSADTREPEYLFSIIVLKEVVFYKPWYG